MARMLKLVGGMAAAGAIAAAGALWWATSAPALPPIQPPAAADFPADLRERGAELAQVGDCGACHTAKGGADYAGGFALPTPFGTIYSTNITPDPTTGIGAWSFEAFDRAMRQGLDREGNHLYPAFPYDHFNKTRDEDMRALYAYFMTLPPVVAEDKPNQMPFPFSFRPMLAGWKLLFLDDTPFTPDPALDDEQNHGAYLAASLAHCGACHTPRNPLGAVIASRPYAGGEAEGWRAPPLADRSIAAVGWTLDDYADYLFDGWSEAHGIAGGPMTPVADHLYDANEDDVFALAAYFAAITPQQPQAEREAAIARASARDWPGQEGQRFVQTFPDPQLQAGADVFARNCAKCHKARISESQPVSLGLTYALNGPSAQNLFNVVRHGLTPPYAVVSRKMQKIELTDAELTDLAAYVRWHFTGKPAWTDIPQALETSRSAAH